MGVEHLAQMKEGLSTVVKANAGAGCHLMRHQGCQRLVALGVWLIHCVQVQALHGLICSDLTIFIASFVEYTED